MSRNTPKTGRTIEIAMKLLGQSGLVEFGKIRYPLGIVGNEILRKELKLEEEIPRFLKLNDLGRLKTDYGARRLQRAYRKIRRLTISYRARFEVYFNSAEQKHVRKQLRKARRDLESIICLLNCTSDPDSQADLNLWNIVAGEQLEAEYAARITSAFIVDNALPPGPQTVDVHGDMESFSNVRQANSLVGSVENIKASLDAVIVTLGDAIGQGNREKIWKNISVEIAVLVWTEFFGDTNNLSESMPIKSNQGIYFVSGCLEMLWNEKHRMPKTLENDIGEARVAISGLIELANDSINYPIAAHGNDRSPYGLHIPQHVLLARAWKLFTRSCDEYFDNQVNSQLMKRDPDSEDVTDAEFLAEYGRLNRLVNARLRRYPNLSR
jgi:hypothetical protein